MQRSTFPTQSVLPHIAARPVVAPMLAAGKPSLRAVALVTAMGLASALGYALGLAAAAGLGSMISAANARPAPRAIPSSTPAGAFDVSRFILNALLAPALDPDAAPLRWVDPRPTMGCGRASTVRVNGEPLRVGALVPDAPFELEWWAQGCRPFGAAGPRLHGGVKLTVFREDWGFSALVEPRGLRAVSAEGETLIGRGGASMPQCIETDRALRCR